MSKTTDPTIFRTVDRDDFPVMLEPERFMHRSDAFDFIVAATDAHYWDPEDTRYIDFSQPFDLENQLLLPRESIPELNCALADRLDERQRIRLGNELTRFHLSQLLHGEQGGLALSASLCHIFVDPGAQEYAANQAREEARHVRALSKYFVVRWGAPLDAGDGLLALMNKLVLSGDAYQKIVGMQMMIEGLALGAFSTIFRSTFDPVLKRLVQLILADEAYHHRFGRVWGEMTIPELPETQRTQVEMWAAGCYATIFRNLSGWKNKNSIYKEFGVDWQWVMEAVKESPAALAAVNRDLNVYRVLARTLTQAGIITKRTRPLYQAIVDLTQKMDDAEWDPTGEIAEATLAELKAIREEIEGKIGHLRR